MANKKDVIIAVLFIFCLIISLFMMVSKTNSQVSKQYDPWLDVNDDGKIDMKDIGYVAQAIWTNGVAVNKTELLYDVNATFTELLSTIGFLNSSIAQLQLELTNLEVKLAILNATRLGEPNYDSGWKAIAQNGYISLDHGLNTTNLLVYMIGKSSDSASPYIHQIDYGGEWCTTTHTGAWWQDLTSMSIRVHRRDNDGSWNWVRIMIWKIPMP